MPSLVLSEVLLVASCVEKRQGSIDIVGRFHIIAFNFHQIVPTGPGSVLLKDKQRKYGEDIVLLCSHDLQQFTSTHSFKCVGF
jgi:hypothetical protein